MGAPTTRRFLVLTATLLLICVTGICNAQKASPQNGAPNLAQPVNIAKPQEKPKPAAPVAAQTGANEEEDSADEPPAAAASATAAPPAKVANKQSDASPKPIAAQSPKGLKNGEKPVIAKATSPPPADADDDEAAALPQAASVSHPQVAAAKAVIKATAPTPDQDGGDEEAAEVPAAQNPKAPKVGESKVSLNVTQSSVAVKPENKAPQKATIPPNQEGADGDESSEAVPKAAEVPPPQNPKAPKVGESKAALNVTQPSAATKPGNKAPQKATIPPNDQEGADGEESGEAVPKVAQITKASPVGGKPLAKATVPPKDQEGDDGTEEASIDLQQPAANKSVILKPGAISKQNETDEDSVTSIVNIATLKPKPLLPLHKIASTTEAAAEGSDDSGEDATPVVVQTKKLDKPTTPKPKATSPPQLPASEEESSVDAAASESGDEPVLAPSPLQPKKNASSSAATPASIPNKQKGGSVASATTHNPQIAVNVPGGPSFQPLEGGAVPPVLARANLAAAATTKQAVIAAKGSAVTRPNHSPTTPPVKGEEESEEGVEDESSGDVNSALVSAVNTEYGSALKNLTQAGVLTEVDYENRHLSDLFALLLENLVNANPGATEKDQRALVHEAAVEFEEVFKAKAASTKNVSEIVRLLNEQILAFQQGPETVQAGTTAPVVPSKGASSPVANGTSKGLPKGPGLATTPPGVISSVGTEDENGEEGATGSPDAISLQTLHLLQNAAGQNKSIPALEAKNASIGLEKEFPNPPAWLSTEGVPAANATESKEPESGESEEAVNGTVPTGNAPSPAVPGPSQNVSVIVPAPEPASTGSQKATTSSGQSSSNAGTTKGAVPVAEPRPTAEPAANASSPAGSGSISESTVASTTSESAESEGPELESNSTTVVSSQQPSSERQPSSEPSPSSPQSGSTTESYWAPETAKPEPSPNVTTPKSNVVLPWTFKIIDPQAEWDSELANKESFQYKTLYGSLIADLKTMFGKLEPQRFIGASIKQFSQGSVVVEGQTELKERVESSQLLDNFLKLLKQQDNKIGGKNVDPVSVTFDGRPSLDLARTASNASGATPAWVIGLSVGGVLLAAIVIAAALIIVRVIRNRRSGSISSVVDSQTVKSSPLPTHLRPLPDPKRGASSSSAGYDNPYATRPDYYRYYQPPYVAPGAVARTYMAGANYYSPYYQQQQGSYSYW